MVVGYRTFAYQPTAPPTDTIPPGPPTGITASYVAPNVEVSWTASTGGPIGYVVARNGQILTPSGQPGTTYTDVGLAPGKYDYQIAAFDASYNFTAPSLKVTATVPLPPDTTKPTVPGTVRAVYKGLIDAIEVSWTASTDTETGVAGYGIYRDGAAIQIVGPTSLVILDRPPQRAAPYVYRVAAYDGASPANISAQSPGSSATRPLPPPVGGLMREHIGISITAPQPGDVGRLKTYGDWCRAGWEDCWSQSEMQAFITAAHAQGLKVLACLQPCTPRYVAWNTARFDQFGAFCAAVANMGVDAIEAGNELNLDIFNDGDINACAQTAATLARAVATAVHAVKPNCPVITCGWSPLGAGPPPLYPQNALDDMLDADATLESVTNGFGFHPYEMSMHPSESTTNPAWNACWWVRTAWGSIVAKGGSEPMWLTEFGKTGTEAAQKEWLTDYFDAFAAHRAAGVVIENVFWHTLYEGQSTTGPAEDTLGILKWTGTQWVEKLAAVELRRIGQLPFTPQTPTDPTPPSQPVIVGVVFDGNSLNVTWQGATDNVAVTGYDIFRNGIRVSSVGANVRTWEDIGRTPGTYSYRVQAKDAAGNLSNLSLPVNGTWPVAGYTFGGDSSGATDVSRAMQDWIYSLPPGTSTTPTKCAFAPKALYWCRKTILWQSRLWLDMDGNGATTFHRTQTEALDIYDYTPGTAAEIRTNSNFRFYNTKHCVFRNMHAQGTNVQDKAGGTGSNPGAPYGMYDPIYEAQHGFDFAGSEDILLDGCNSTNQWGDHVYFGSASVNDPGGVAKPQRITVQNGTFIRSGRQGCAPTDCIDVTIQDCHFHYMRRGAVDMEPAGTTGEVLRLKILRNTFNYIFLNFTSSQGQGDVSYIWIEDNTITNGGLEIEVADDNHDIRHHIYIRRNTCTRAFDNALLASMQFRFCDEVYVENNTQAMDRVPYDLTQYKVNPTTGESFGFASYTFAPGATQGVPPTKAINFPRPFPAYPFNPSSGGPQGLMSLVKFHDCGPNVFASGNVLANGLWQAYVGNNIADPFNPTMVNGDPNFIFRLERIIP